jgi:hypothetical protein
LAPRAAAISSSTARSISSQVVKRPAVNRTAPRPCSTGTPIALSTGDCFTFPSWHADPVEAAMPGTLARSSEPVCPRKLTLSVFGRHCRGWPFLRTLSPRPT